MSDNTTFVAYLQHQGGTVSRVLCRMATEVVLWTERHLVSLTVRYVPGKKNALADQLSRPSRVLPTELSPLRSSPSQPLCHPHQCQASSVYISGSRPDDLEAERVSGSSTLGTIFQPMPSHCLLCLGRYCREFFSRWFWWCRCGPRRLADMLSLLVDEPLELPQVWNLLVQPPCAEVPLRSRDPLASCVKVIQRLVQKAGFFKEVVRVASAALYQSKWSSCLVGAISGVSIPARCLSLR